MKRTIFSLLFFLVVPLNAVEKVKYTFSTEPIDVVIPCHPKDASQLDRCIASVRQQVHNLRRVMVVSAYQCTDKAEWIDENIFPFSKGDIALEIFGSGEDAQQHINKPRSRIGWLYQQFLKLYAPLCIPDISSNVLIVDADVVFLQPMQFMQRNGAGVYAVGSEFNPDYFEHAGRVLPNLHKRKFKSYSGVVHHMLFQRPVIKDLFDLIKRHHGGLEPWVAIARNIPVDDEGNVAFSAMSEYEIYFNFVFSRTDQVKIRHVRWTNAFSSEHKGLDYYIREGYAYVAIHNWE